MTERVELANFLVLWTAGCLFFLSGCGDSSSQLHGITGEVLWGGEPLSHGNITLKPLTTGSATGGAIKDGVFNIPPSRGVVPGNYLVAIEAYLPTGRQLRNDDKPGEMVDETKQMIPARYNRNSDLRAAVGPDSENHFTFQLEKK